MTASSTYSDRAVPAATAYEEEWTPDLAEADRELLRQAQNDPDRVVELRPRSPDRLSYFSILCLIFNRMIGTGVFNSASVVFPNTQSIGASLMIWFYGCVVALTGVLVYNELGLTIPRWRMGDEGYKVSTPRSGGELNYLNYFVKSPRFMATCLFGVSFLILGTTAANSVAFGQNVLLASQVDLTPGKVCAIALAGNTFCCLLHSISRRWGIRLNNVLGSVKFLMLIFIILIGLIWVDHSVAAANFDTSSTFSSQNSPKLPYRYTEAILFVMFAFGGFHQVNYVLAEIDQPRRKFVRASRLGVLIIAILFMVINILYAAVVPQQELFTQGVDIGFRFFQLTLGKVVRSQTQLQTIWSSLKATSALGNIIVVTFVAARVKQEIAKEGVLPFSLIFAKNYDFTLRRLFGQVSTSTGLNVHLHSEKTPVATLALHWILTNILVFAAVFSIKPYPFDPTPAYTFLVSSYAYIVDIACFAAVGFGLLYLRLFPSLKWAGKSQFQHRWISTGCAAVFLLLNLYPLVFMWVPDPAAPFLSRTDSIVPWYASQTLGVCAVASALVYWLGFYLYLHVYSRAEGKEMRVERRPIFRDEGDGLTPIYEIVTQKWVETFRGDITLRQI